MKKILLTTLLALTFSAAHAADLNTTLTDQDAQNYTLTLGPGSLATITLPDPAKNIIVTRSGLIETTTVNNRVIIAGLSGTGTTPLQISTETGVWTWRVKMSAANASSIMNITVLPPEDATPKPVAATPDTSPNLLGLIPTTGMGQPVRLQPTTIPALKAAPAPAAPLPSAAAPVKPSTANELLTLGPTDLPGVSFTLQRDGDLVRLDYRVRAGARGLAIDERTLQVSGTPGTVNTKPNLGALLLSPDETRYGTILLSGAPTGTAQVIWPYRVGPAQQQLAQNILVP